VHGFSPSELADYYARTIERGTPIKYGPVVNPQTQQVPNLGGKIEFELVEAEERPHPEDLQYAYYFYPLQAFQHELANQHGFSTVVWTFRH
jgi:hypothetical protein